MEQDARSSSQLSVSRGSTMHGVSPFFNGAALHRFTCSALTISMQRFDQHDPIRHGSAFARVIKNRGEDRHLKKVNRHRGTLLLLCMCSHTFTSVLLCFCFGVQQPIRRLYCVL